MVTKEEIDAFVDFCRGADDIRVTSATWGRVVPALADENDRLREAFETEAKWRTNATDENAALRAQLAEAVALLEAAPIGGTDAEVSAWVERRAKLRGAL